MGNGAELLLALWGYLAVGGTGLLLAGASFCFVSRSGRRRLLPMQRLRPVYWTGRDVAAAFLAYFLISPMVHEALVASGIFQAIYGERPPNVAKKDWQIRLHLWTAVATTPLILGAIFFILRLISRTRPAQVGWTFRRWAHNLMVGFGGYVVLTPLALAIHYAATLFLEEIGHSFEDLGRRITMPMEWLLLVFQAAVAAPLLEETLFRGLLQGWLRRATLPGHGVLMGLTLLVSASFLLEPGEANAADEILVAAPIFAGILMAGYAALLGWIWVKRVKPMALISAESASDLEDNSPEAAEAPMPVHFLKIWLPYPAEWSEQKARAWVALYGQAMLFAVFHSMAWPSPIPLFFFGLGLGWLAQRTGSIFPSVFTHALFNAVACVVLYFGVR